MDGDLHWAKESAAKTQSGIVLPSQYFGPVHKQAPERRLMIAVLHDALECIEKYRHATETSDRRLLDEAKQWFLDTDTDWPCSFERICGVLDLDADAIRQRLSAALAPQPLVESRAALIQG